MQLILKRNAVDDNMIEIWGTGANADVLIAVTHVDSFLWDADIYDALRDDDMVRIETRVV